jgi:hypothetical protein
VKGKYGYYITLGTNGKAYWRLGGVGRGESSVGMLELAVREAPFGEEAKGFAAGSSGCVFPFQKTLSRLSPPQASTEFPEQPVLQSVSLFTEASEGVEFPQSIIMLASGV